MSNVTQKHVTPPATIAVPAVANSKEQSAPAPKLCGERHGKTIAAWLAHDAVSPFDVRTSLPVTEAWHRNAIKSIVDSDCLKGGDLVGEVIEIGHYILHPCEMRDDETGELTDGVRTLFPQSDRPPVAFVANSILDQISKLAWALGNGPPWDPPIKVKIRQVSSRGKKRVYKLDQVK